MQKKQKKTYCKNLPTPYHNFFLIDQKCISHTSAHYPLLHSTVLLSSFFDKSHLELWGKKQVLIQRASNLSHCLKSWKNIWPRGLFNTIFSIYPHLPGLFSPSKKWVMTAVKEMGFVTEILSLPPSPSPPASFATYLESCGYWHINAYMYHHSNIQTQRVGLTSNNLIKSCCTLRNESS